MQPNIKMLETIAFPEVNASFISTLNNTAEEENNNLFIWLPEIGMDENGVAQLEFSTPKKRGEFVIAVQGISAGRRVCRQISFKVME